MLPDLPPRDLRGRFGRLTDGERQQRPAVPRRPLDDRGAEIDEPIRHPARLLVEQAGDHRHPGGLQPLDDRRRQVVQPARVRLATTTSNRLDRPARSTPSPAITVDPIGSRRLRAALVAGDR